MDLSDLPAMAAGAWNAARNSSFVQNPYVNAYGAAFGDVASMGLRGLSALPRAFGDTYSANAFSKAADYMQPTIYTPLQTIQNRGWLQGGFPGFAEKAATTAEGMAPYIVGGELAAPEKAVAALPGAWGRLEGFVPEAFGGTASNRVSAAVAGMTIPTSVGSMEAQNEARPGGPTRSGAAQALAVGAPVGMLEAMVPAGILTRATGRLGARALTSTLGGAAAGAIGGGVQTAADLSERPDISPTDKVNAIVSSVADSAISAGLVGGLFGALGGRQPTNEELKAAIDAPMKQGAPATAPVPDAVLRGPVGTGEGTTRIYTGTNAAPAAEAAIARMAAGESIEPLGEQIARQAGVKISEVPLLQNLQATSLPAARNEIEAHPDAANYPAVLNALGIGRDINGEISQHLAENPNALEDLAENPSSPAATKLTELGQLAELRDQATALKQAQLSSLKQAEGAKTAPGSIALTSGEESFDPFAYSRKAGTVIGAKSKGAFGDFLRDNAKTASPADLYLAAQSEIAAQTPVTKTKNFGRLLSALEKDPRVQETVNSPHVAFSGEISREAPQNDRSMAAANIAPGPGVVPEAEEQPAPGPIATARKEEEESIASKSPVTVGEQNAVPKSSTAGVDVRQPSANGEEMGGRDAERNASAQEEVVAQERREGEPEETDLTESPEDIPAFLRREIGRGGDTPSSVDSPTARAAGLSPSTEDEGQPPAPVISPVAKVGGARGALMPEAVDRHVAGFLSRLRPDIADHLHLIDSSDEVPPDVEAAAEREGHNVATLSGFYHNGEVYINRSLVKNRADLEDTLSHEVFGHLATAENLGAPGGAYDSAVSDIFDRAGGYEGIKRIAQKFGVWDGTSVGGAGVRSYLPPGGWRMTPDDKTRAVEELFAHASASSAKVGDLQRALMAITGRFKQGIAARLRDGGLNIFANKLSRFDANDMAKWINDTRAALQAPDRTYEGGTPGNSARAVMAKMIPAQIDGVSRIARDVLRPAYDAIQTNLVDFMRDTSGSAQPGEAIGSIARSETYRNAKKLAMVARSLSGLSRSYGDELPAIREGYDLAQLRNAMRRSAQAPAADVLTRFSAAARKNRAAAAIVQTLMRGSAYGLDPLKPWADHTWLHSSPNVGDLQAAHAELQGYFNRLGQPFKDSPAFPWQDMYRSLAAVSRGQWYARYAMFLHQAVEMMKLEIPGFQQNPMRMYNFASELHRDPAATEQFWKTQYQARMAASRNFLTQQASATAPQGGSKVVTPVGTAVSGLRELLGLVTRAEQSQINRAQYFRLGRIGDYTTSLHFRPEPGAAAALPPGADRDALPPDPAAIKEAQRLMDEARLRDVDISNISSQRHAFMRFSTQTAQRNMMKIAQDLYARGFLEKAPSQAVVGGENSLKGVATPAVFTHLMATAKDAFADLYKSSDPDVRKAADIFLNSVRNSLFEILPSPSWRETLLPRRGIQGFDKNMMQSFASRAMMHAQEMSTLATSQEFSSINRRLEEQVAAKGNAPLDTMIRARDAADEYIKHMATASLPAPKSFIQHLTALTHSAQLGFSGTFTAMQLAQPGLLTAPELAKKFGNTRANLALGNAIPDVVRVFNAMRQMKEMSVTPEILRESGLSADMSKYLMRLANWGVMELTGTFGAGESYLPETLGFKLSSKYQQALQVANATATASEIWGRLQSAIAAYNLWHDHPLQASSGRQFEDVVDYGRHIVNEGMMTWGSFDTPRLFHSNGPWGAFGPLAGQFKQFQIKYYEKFLHETLNTLTEQGVPRADGARWLRSNLAFSLVIGGLLGLPGVGVLAEVAYQLSKVFHDGIPFDVESGVHHLLDTMLGPRVGEALARGIPRQIGVDSADWGAAEVPAQELFEDSRSVQDKVSDAASMLLGPAGGMISNSVEGAIMIANGQVVPGTIRMLPHALKGAAQGLRIAATGKILTNNGVPLPMTPGAADILITALGMTPGKVAEYRERSTEIENMQNSRAAKANFLKLNAAQALERGDIAGYQRALANIRQFQQMPMNRTMPIFQELQQLIRQRAMQPAQARALGTTLGVSPRDLGLRDLANWGDLSRSGQ